MLVRRRRSCRSSASPAATSPARAGRSTGAAARCAALPLPAGLAGGRASCRSRSSRPRPRPRRGHDENISFERHGRGTSGPTLRPRLRDRSARRVPPGRGVRRGTRASSSPTPSSNGAGCRSGELILIDEVLTPDSSRFWPADSYRAGRSPAVVRQAVRPRLAGDDRLGQEQPAAGAAGRRGRQDRGEVPRGSRAAPPGDAVLTASCPPPEKKPTSFCHRDCRSCCSVLIRSSTQSWIAAAVSGEGNSPAEYIGQGIGQGLLEPGEKFLLEHGINAYFCFVHKDNDIGQRFYSRSGFQRIPEKDQDDEWYLEKKLIFPESESPLHAAR